MSTQQKYIDHRCTSAVCCQKKCLDGVCFRKFFGELSIESRVRLSVRTLFVTPRHTASFPLRVSMARSLLMAAEDTSAPFLEKGTTGDI